MAPEWISGLLLITGIYYVQTVTYNNEGSGWAKYNFQLNNTWNDCSGQKWIHLIIDGVNTGKIVGVILCTPPGRYGIFMTHELTKTFVKLGDLWESGEDHCELLGMTDVDNRDSRVVLGPVLNKATTEADPNAPTKYPGYYRKLPGDEFQYKVDLEVDSATGNAWTPKWYECGDIQFVPADEVCGEITCPHTCVVQGGQPVCKCNIGYTQVNGVCTVPLDTRDTELLKVWPNFGPEAGGTAITVTGKQFPHQYPMTVNIGHILCNTTIQNSTTVIAITPSLVEQQIIDTDLPIYLTVGNISLNTPDAGHTYTYKGNPVIDDVYPKESIVKGGTKLTANGNNLDSVSVIVMDTTMVHRKRIERVYNETIVIYNTNCDTQNRTQMLCPTPAIELPDEFKNTFTKLPNGDGLKITKGNDTLQFYIGFRLDGVQGYENFTSIEIFAEPFFRFKSKYIFKENTRLQFEGDNLDKGITVYDYTITIGMEDCGRLELKSNSLSCLPPQEEPPKLEENLNFDNQRIVIHAGLNIKHAAGHLEYPDSALPWYILYIVVPVCGVIIIVIIIAIIVVCCKRRNRPSRANQGNTKRNGFKNNAYSQND